MFWAPLDVAVAVLGRAADVDECRAVGDELAGFRPRDGLASAQEEEGGRGGHDQHDDCDLGEHGA